MYLLKLALIDFLANTDVPSPYKVDLANLLGNSFLFTRQADIGQH